MKTVFYVILRITFVGVFKSNTFVQVELKEGEETIDSNGDMEDRQSDEKEEGEVRDGAKTPPNPGPPQAAKKEFDLDAYLHNKCQFCGFIARQEFKIFSKPLYYSKIVPNVFKCFQ